MDNNEMIKKEDGFYYIKYNKDIIYHSLKFIKEDDKYIISHNDSRFILNIKIIIYPYKAFYIIKEDEPNINYSIIDDTITPFEYNSYSKAGNIYNVRKDKKYLQYDGKFYEIEVGKCNTINNYVIYKNSILDVLTNITFNYKDALKKICHISNDIVFTRDGVFCLKTNKRLYNYTSIYVLIKDNINFTNTETFYTKENTLIILNKNMKHNYNHSYKQISKNHIIMNIL